MALHYRRVCKYCGKEYSALRKHQTLTCPLSPERDDARRLKGYAQVAEYKRRMRVNEL